MILEHLLRLKKPNNRLMLQPCNLCRNCYRTLPSFCWKRLKKTMCTGQTSQQHMGKTAGSGGSRGCFKISSKFLPKDKYLCPPTERKRSSKGASSNHRKPIVLLDNRAVGKVGGKWGLGLGLGLGVRIGGWVPGVLEKLCARLHRLPLRVQKWAT